MRHEYENARRHATNTLAEVNRHLDRGNLTNRQHHMLTDMAEKATRTLENLDRLDNARPYSDTNIGYNADMRRGRTRSDVDDVVAAAMDAVDRILPHLADDDRYDVDDRQGVPGTGPYANPRLRRRGGRKGIGRRRADMDDRYDDRYDDDWDDDRYDVDDARRRRLPRRGRSGRFVRGDTDRYNRYDDDQYDDVRRMADEARRTADDARRTADEARRTADDARNANPVDRSDRTRYDAARYDRRDDRTDDRPGPRV